ncbi:MAG: oligo-alginate lyase, partial [Verrucomicrobiota bacterium]
SAAYVLTGDSRYAHKAAVLLDRVADLYPSFNFASQGFVYEVAGHNGYVSVWHDACEETYDLVLAYDQIFEGLQNDSSLLEFLSAQSKRYQLGNPKKTLADVQRNIEGGMLRDPLAHGEKIHSNFPRHECTIAMIQTILGWPENRKTVEKMMDTFIAPATAVDGVTGEKGLAGYTSYTIAAMARFFGEYSRSDPNFLHELLQRNPRLRETYRFHIDTHCLQRYYPLSGDTGSFGQPIPQYAVGLVYSFRPASQTPLIPSLDAFLWQLYRETGDPAYVQTLYSENKGSTKDLPYNLFERDPKAVQKEVAKVIAREGLALKLGSMDKKQWHLAILRSGQGENERAVWLDYDSGGGHGHLDGMTLGLFAQGLDLLPDFGYPLVQFGGWFTPRATWYKMTAAHNTVVIDGQNQPGGAGQTTLWADGASFHAIRASGPAIANAKQFERTVSLVDVSKRDCYVVDVFRVIGGGDHAKFVHGYFGTIKPEGLTFSETNEFGNGTQTRDFRRDAHARPGWNITWQCEDRLKLLPKGREVKMRYTDLTADAEALAGEAWIVPSGREETWNPCVITRRRGPAPLASTFVGVIEPFSGKSRIAHIRRLPLLTAGGTPLGDSYVALEISLADGDRDLFIAADAENPARPAGAPEGIVVQADWSVRLDGELCWIRKDSKGKLARFAFAKGRWLQVGDRKFESKGDSQFTEVVLKN